MILDSNKKRRISQGFSLNRSEMNKKKITVLNSMNNFESDLVKSRVPFDGICFQKRKPNGTGMTLSKIEFEEVSKF